MEAWCKDEADSIADTMAVIILEKFMRVEGLSVGIWSMNFGMALGVPLLKNAMLESMQLKA